MAETVTIQGQSYLKRSPLGVIGLTIITLGIYTLYWVFKTQEEVKNHSGIGVGGVLGLVIYIVVSPVTDGACRGMFSGTTRSARPRTA